VEGFKYIVTLSRPGATLPTEQEGSYKQLSEVESALQQVGGPALVDIAGKILGLGHPFTHIMELTNSQRSILVKQNS